MLIVLLRTYIAVLLVMTSIVAIAPDREALGDLMWALLAPGYGLVLLAHALEVPFMQLVAPLLPARGAPLNNAALAILFIGSIVPVMLVSFVSSLIAMPETIQKSPGTVLLFPLKLWFGMVMLFGVVMTIFSRSV